MGRGFERALEFLAWMGIAILFLAIAVFGIPSYGSEEAFRATFRILCFTCTLKAMTLLRGGRDA